MKKILFSALLSAQIAFCANLVVLDPAAIEMIYSLGAQDQIKAIAKTSMSKIWPADEVAKLPSVGGYIKPNLEKIVALKPDLVIASYHSTSTADELKNLGIKSMVLNANSIDEICTNLDKIAQIVEKKGKSSEICNEIQAKCDGKTALQGKKGLFVFS